MFSHLTALCAILAIAASLAAQTGNPPPGMAAVIRDFDRTASEAVQNPADVSAEIAPASSQSSEPVYQLNSH